MIDAASQFRQAALANAHRHLDFFRKVSPYIGDDQFHQMLGFNHPEPLVQHAQALNHFAGLVQASGQPAHQYVGGLAQRAGIPLAAPSPPPLPNLGPPPGPPPPPLVPGEGTPVGPAAPPPPRPWPLNQWGDPWQQGDPFVNPLSGRVQAIPGGDPRFPILVHATPRNPSGAFIS